MRQNFKGTPHDVKSHFRAKDGNMEIVKEIIKATGLPENLLNKEFEKMIAKAGLKQEELTLEQVRELLVEYLQETLVTAKDTY